MSCFFLPCTSHRPPVPPQSVPRLYTGNGQVKTKSNYKLILCIPPLWSSPPPAQFPTRFTRGRAEHGSPAFGPPPCCFQGRSKSQSCWYCTVDRTVACASSALISCSISTSKSTFSMLSECSLLSVLSIYCTQMESPFSILFFLPFAQCLEQRSKV